MLATSPLSEPQERRVLALQRAFQRELRRKPTSLQRTLMLRAATLTAKAEAALVDTATTANDAVRLDNAAKRARAEMFRAITKPSAPSLQQLLRVVE